MQKWLLFFVLVLICVSINPEESLMADSSPSSGRNHVLSLDGKGSYMEIANSESLNVINSQVTVEAWIKPTAFPKDYVPIIYKGDKPPSSTSASFSNRSYTLWIEYHGLVHITSAPTGQTSIYYSSPSKTIPINRWSHIAGVIDCKSGVMRIFVNGVEVAEGNFGRDIHISKLPLMIGGHPEDIPAEGFFSGDIDEVRIWKIARTQDEIKKTMFSRLLGNESGLVGYWNFDDPKKIKDLSNSHADGKFIGNAHTIEAEFVKADVFYDFAGISGIVKDRSGQVIPNAVIRLEQNGNEIKKVYSDAAGSYSLIVKQPTDKPYDLFAFFGTKYGDQKTGIRLSNGDDITINAVVKESISIEGSILMMDDNTPHKYIPIQAVSNGKVYAAALSDESGIYCFVNLKPGEYQIRCHVKGGDIYYMHGKTLSVEPGKTIKNIDFRLPSFDSSNAWTQNTGQVVIQPSNEYRYIADWLTLGPFFPDDLNKDFLADVGGEENIEPREGDTVTRSDGTDLTWKRYKFISQWPINLMEAVGDYKNATAYVFCILQSEIAGNTQICIGHTFGAAVWINGKRVYNGNTSVASDELVFDVNLKAGANRCLIKVSQSQESAIWALAMRVFPPQSAIISGIITDEKGRREQKIPVILEENGKEVAWTLVDDAGDYCLGVRPGSGLYDLFVTSGNLGYQRLGIRLHEGEHQKLNIMLKEAISIEGKLLMLDDKTPHVAVPVQAIYDGKVIATALSDEEGKYQIINLKPGRYQVRCQILGGYVYYIGNASRTATGETLKVETRKILKDINFRFAPFKKGVWKNYNTVDGLPLDYVFDIYRDKDGIMWFATQGGGISRFDGKRFVNFNTQGGLADAFSSPSICPGADGIMWIGTDDGVCQYDGKQFRKFTTKNGLANNIIRKIYCDPKGRRWLTEP